MAKYSKEQIEQILAQNAELQEFKDREEERRQAQRERNKESGAYRANYEKQKQRMIDDPEYAEKVKAQRRAYQENRKATLKAEKEELERYRKEYGPLS